MGVCLVPNLKHLLSVVSCPSVTIWVLSILIKQLIFLAKECPLSCHRDGSWFERIAGRHLLVFDDISGTPCEGGGYSRAEVLGHPPVLEDSQGDDGCIGPGGL